MFQPSLFKDETGNTPTAPATKLPSLPKPIRVAFKNGASPEAAFEEYVAYDKRKSRGQFFTPEPVAMQMVSWATGSHPKTFLDPAVGPGIFPSKIRKARSKRLSVQLIDIEPLALSLSKHRLDGHEFQKLQFHKGDFLQSYFEGSFDAIVSNPPYIRHHEAKLPESLFHDFEAQFGLRFSRLTNIYCFFLLKIASLLSSSGRAAVITPTEFLNADFGVAVKRVLCNLPGFLGFLIIDYRKSVFEKLLTTATITLFDVNAADNMIKFVHSDGVEHLENAFASFLKDGRENNNTEDVDVTVIPKNELDPKKKWSSIRSNSVTFNKSGALRPLSDFGKCTRGIATGANAYFTLTDNELKEAAIPKACMKKCITKASHAKAPAFTDADFQRLANENKKVWILDVSDDARPEVAQYVTKGIRSGVSERYLPRHRSPWYSIEQRLPADIWVTVFGREKLRFVRNLAGIRNLTAFHGIYLAKDYCGYVDFLMAYFYSSTFGVVCSEQHRVYGDGLLKYEPKDVCRLLVPDLQSIRPAFHRKGTSLGKKLQRQTTADISERLQSEINNFFDGLVKLHTPG